MRDPPFIPTPLPLLKKRPFARFDPSVKKKVFFNFDAEGLSLDEEGFLLEGEEKKDGNLIEIRFGWLYRDGHKLQLGQLRKEGGASTRKGNCRLIHAWSILI